MSKNNTTLATDVIEKKGDSIEKLFGNEVYEKVHDLYMQKNDSNVEFEFIFSNRIITQEKYINLLRYLKLKKNKFSYVSEGPTDTLDIIYSKEESESYRITIEGNDQINYNIKQFDAWKNHVLFSILCKKYKNKTTKNISLMKKSKGVDKTIDITELNMRARSSYEEDVTEEEMEMLTKLDHTQMDNIVFRLKQRFSVYILKTDKEFVRIDLTSTKTNKKHSYINKTYSNYELEIEHGVYKKNTMPSEEAFKTMTGEIEILHKIIQQSNFIITESKALEVLNYYKTIAGASEKIIKLVARQSISLEIQHVTDTLPDKYAVTDKADGERYFLVVMDSHVYFISNNLHVKNSGIDLKTDIYNGTVLDGEYIFIPKLNRHLFMIFDCLFFGAADMRDEISFMKRLRKTEEIIKKCFVFDGQTGFDILDYIPKKEYDLNEIVSFHSKQIDQYMTSINNDIKHQKNYPLIRRKYFIDVKGAKKWEIFKFSELMWKKYTEDSVTNCPYHLDGLIYHPLEQAYITDSKKSKMAEFKWKPLQKNSIDFYIQFERDPKTGKVLTVYDNSNDEYLKNKPYRICRLFVGRTFKFKEQPFLFREKEELFWAYLFLTDGDARDVEGNVISDNTVVEFCYNSDPEVHKRFRWVPLRTRHDKTESVLKYGRQYGNYFDMADKVWSSISNPILMSDFSDLAKGNVPEKGNFMYDKKIESLRNKIDHTTIANTTRGDAYYRLISGLAKPFRQWHNFLKSNIIYTYCNPIYQKGRRNTVLDIACGRGGDLLKMYYATVLEYVGIDVSLDGLTSKVNGAESRYEEHKRTHANFFKTTFIHADARAPLDYESQVRALGGMSDKNKGLMEKYFNSDPKRGFKFDRINCQFAVHYFLKDETTWKNFKLNINNTLKNGGYIMLSHFDAKKVINVMKNIDKYSVDYTDDKGKKNKLFEIIKKYNDADVEGEIRPGHAIDIYASWMFNEGTYMTEYLVDIDFIKKDLLADCDLECVDTDLFENQFNIYEDFFKNYAKYEENVETNGFLKNTAAFFKPTELNMGCYKYSFLTRYSIFRKKDVSTVQSGGELDFSDRSRFYIPTPKMNKDDGKYTYLSSVHSVLQAHKIIPSSISMKGFYNDVKIKLKEDSKIDNDYIKQISKSLVIQNEIDFGDKVASELALNGLNTFLIEKDCNGSFDVDLIQKTKTTPKDKAIILLKENGIYKPVYKIDVNGRKKGLIKMSDNLIENLLLVSDEY